MVCADNQDVEVYKKQRNNRRLPQENETDTTNGLRLSKLRKLQIEGLGSMRRLSLKSTLFGVDPIFAKKIDKSQKTQFPSQPQKQKSLQIH